MKLGDEELRRVADGETHLDADDARAVVRELLQARERSRASGAGGRIEYHGPKSRLVEHHLLIARMLDDDGLLEAVYRASEVVVDTVRNGGTVYSCGNGGSMAQAQHFVAELTGRYQRERKPLAAVALGSNPAHLTAVANDYGYEEVFAREASALGIGIEGPGDCLVLLSTSGRSANMLRVAEVADIHGCPLVWITGGGSPRFPDWHHVRIPSTDTALIQEATIHVLHSICAAVDDAMGET